MNIDTDKFYSYIKSWHHHCAAYHHSNTPDEFTGKITYYMKLSSIKPPEPKKYNKLQTLIIKLFRL